MCDYSLYTFSNRLARDGEELVASRFPSGCIGFIGISDAPMRESRRTRCGLSWPQLKPWFFPRSNDGPVAVCVPPGTEMRLVAIDPELRLRLGLDETEDANFIQTSAEAFAYRDGLQFRNGRRILLQELPEGQRAFVSPSSIRKSRSCHQNVAEEAHA